MTINEKILNLDFINTSSHGYLKISKPMFNDLNLNENEFSQCSYYQPNNNSYYLEEDCDAPKFIKIIKNKGYKVNLIEVHIDDIFLGINLAA